MAFGKSLHCSPNRARYFRNRSASLVLAHQLGMPAERLAKTSAARIKGYVESDAFAGPYLADQLILLFVLAGDGGFTTVKPSQHTLTAIDIARRFTGKAIRLEQQSGGSHLVSFG